MSSRRETRAATALLNTTGTAAANVIAARMLAFSNPATMLSPWHQSETRRMTAEKIDATTDGMQAAGMELAMLPARIMMIGARPASWTPAGWMNAWNDVAGLWIGVGNAALRPARNTAVRNQRRLSRTSR
ncbi:hypothetical protein [Thermomonas carbonis]|uniref:Uncharacterized protein n=1 Tax=Thermomonas carbonis TaxID=1463158 RepID=A0A7G9STW3_9GAMM|nr:hypothetical protein [Thermomonas carbonis]QNN71288.1 hypothetical protein H9L16_06970 [Thermomonas carbonis]GHC10621.1 hypothetical protein GCM10010080_27760 [Thermomonas carbonis]